MQNYKKLIGPISIISLAYLMSRIFGFVREILLANWTGISNASDTLDLAFVIPDFLFYLSAGGYLAITLIPLLSRFEKEDDDKLNSYFLSLLNGLLSPSSYQKLREVMLIPKRSPVSATGKD